MMTIRNNKRCHFLDWRSSAAPKKTAASCKIVFARTNSRFSRRNAYTCARKSSTEPGCNDTPPGFVVIGEADFTHPYNVK